MNMKNISRLTFLFLMAWSALCYAYDDEDFQVWNTDVEEFQIGTDTRLALEEEFHWGDNAGEFYYQHYDIGIRHGFNRHLIAGAGYRQIYERKNGDFKEENSSYVIAILFFEESGFVFEDCNKIEYKDYDYQQDFWRYRNKFTLRLPFKFTKFELQPYVSDEIFVGFASATNQFNQNRAQAGFGMKLLSWLKAEIYYMRLSVKGSAGWREANVLGTKMKLSF